MARGFNIDDADQFIESDQFKALYNSIKDLNSSVEPASREGALWIDSSSGELKQCVNSQWTNLYDKKFQVTEHIVDGSMPDTGSAVGGELWIDPKTNVLNYFNGSSFGPVKAVSSDIDFNSSFMDFLMLGPMNPLENISYLGDMNTAESKFLIPDSTLDKIFINNTIDNNYTKLSASSIKYNYSDIAGKNITAVHVLPDRLTKIDKKIFMINKFNDNTVDVWPIANRFIDMPNLNTEFYGFKDGKSSFLVNSNDDNGDYKAYKQGIVLSTNATKYYDFIVAIRYIFGSTKQKGICQIVNIDTDTASRVIYVGKNIQEPMVLFINGMAVYESLGAFTYSKDTGFVVISNDIVGQCTVTILSFPRKKEGIAYDIVDDGTNVSLTIPNAPQYNKPILFFQGVALSEDLGQFAYDSTNYTITVKCGASSSFLNIDAIKKNGMPFCIVETLDKINGCDMYVKSGLVEDGTAIGIPYTSGSDTQATVGGVTINYDLPFDIDGVRTVSPIIFAMGLCIPQDQIKDHDSNLLAINDLTVGVPYIFLRNIAYIDSETNTLNNNRIIYDGISKDITIPFGTINDGIVYADNSLILEPTFAVTSKITDTLNSNEIKKLNGTWIYYNGTETAITDSNLIDLLETSINQFIRTTHAICISTSGVFKNIVCYGYQLGNAIEYPLQTLEFDIEADKNMYNLFYKHTYAPDTNSMFLWANGVRQYDCLEDSTYNFEYLESIDGTGQYIIEKPEGNEKQSCARISLDYRNKISGVDNIFKSSISLMPGNLRLYIGGLRQPREAFTLLDPYTIQINGDVIGGSSDFKIDVNGIYLKPEVSMIDNVPDVKYVPLEQFDSMLLEIRNDYKIMECTIPIREAGQNVLSLYEDNLPEDLFAAEDLVTIYIDGLLFDCRALSEDEIDNKCIYLINKAFGDEGNLIEPNKDFVILEWR